MFTSTYCSSLIAVHRSPLIAAYRSPLIAIRRSPFFVRRLPFAPHRLPPFTVHCPSPSRHIVNKCVLCVFLKRRLFHCCLDLLLLAHCRSQLTDHRRLPFTAYCHSPFSVFRSPFTVRPPMLIAVHCSASLSSQPLAAHRLSILILFDRSPPFAGYCH